MRWKCIHDAQWAVIGFQRTEPESPVFASMLQNASPNVRFRTVFREKNTSKTYKRTPSRRTRNRQPQLRDPDHVPAVREATIQPIDLALLDVGHVFLDMHDFQILLREIQE